MRRRLVSPLLALLLASCALPATAPGLPPAPQQVTNQQAGVRLVGSADPVPSPNVVPSAPPTGAPSVAPTAVATPPGVTTVPDWQNLVLPTGFISKAKLIASTGSAATLQAPNTAIAPSIGATIGTQQPAFAWATQAPSADAYALPAWISSDAVEGLETDRKVGDADATALDLQLWRLVQAAVADFQATADAGNGALASASSQHLTAQRAVAFSVDPAAEPMVSAHLRVLTLHPGSGQTILDGYRVGSAQPVVQYLSLLFSGTSSGKTIYSDGLGGHDGALRASLSFDLSAGTLDWRGFLDFGADAQHPALVSKRLLIGRIDGSTDLSLALVQSTHALAVGQTTETDVVLARITQDGRAAAIAGRQVFGVAPTAFDFLRDASGKPLVFDYFASATQRGAALAPAAPGVGALDPSWLPADVTAIDAAADGLAFPSTDASATIAAYGAEATVPTP